MFSTPRLGEVVSNARVPDPIHISRRFMAAERLLYPAGDASIIRPRASLLLAKETRHSFAVPLVWQSNDTGFHDARMSEEPLFNFRRYDIFAPYGGLVCETLYKTKAAMHIPRIIMSLIRPVTRQYPCSSMTPSSPVCIHTTPSESARITSAVFSAFFKYPFCKA